MVSREECDDAFRSIGLERFSIIDDVEFDRAFKKAQKNPEIYVRPTQLPSMPSRDFRWLTARRCQALCRGEPDRARCIDRTSAAFDLASSAGRCFKPEHFLPDVQTKKPSCVFLIQPLKDADLYKVIPLYRNTVLYRKLVESGFRRTSLKNLLTKGLISRDYENLIGLPVWFSETLRTQPQSVFVEEELFLVSPEIVKYLQMTIFFDPESPNPSPAEFLSAEMARFML